MLLDFLLLIRLLQNQNSGIISEDNLRQNQLKDKYSQLTKYSKEDLTTSKLMVLFSDINQELVFIICTKSSEIFPSTEQSVNSTWKWLVTTEPQETQSLSSELLFSTAKMILEEAILIYLEITQLSSLSPELLLEQAKTDIKAFSKAANLELLDNDCINI